MCVTVKCWLAEKMQTGEDLQWLAKVFIALEIFHILSHYDNKYILCERPT